MSKVKLQSITSIHRTSEYQPFYVGSIIDSESGYLIPKLITSTQQIDTIFGDYPYSQMYKDLIHNNIPVCLMPVITPESKYNVCSLRLSNGLITVSHPKKDKKYTYVSLSSIISTSFKKSDLDDDNSITITHPLEFYPRIVIESESNEVRTQLTYSDKKIKLTFSEKIDGTISIESFPQLESDPDFIKIGYFGKLGDTVTPTYEFKVPNKIIPEIVLTRFDTNIRLGDKVEANVSISDQPDDSGYYTIKLSPTIPEFDCRYRVDIRIIPSSLIVTKSAMKETFINHNGGRYPLFKIEHYGYEAWGKVEFRTENYAVISVTDINNTFIRYNIVTAESDFDFNLLSTGQTTFNLILDFTNVSYADLTKVGSRTDNSNYIIINTVTEDCLIASGEWHGVTSNFYNTNAVYYLQPSEGSTVDIQKYNTLNKLKDWYNNRYAETCSSLEDLIIDFIRIYINKNGLPQVDQYGHQVFIKYWKQDLINASYIEDFWLESNEYVARILEEVLEKYSETNIVSSDSLVNDIVNLKLSNSKLLFEYALPIQDLNHYRFEGLKISNSLNLSQDKLCNFTEQDKVVEFYSKIKGPTGRKIQVTISKVNFYEGLYDINITNGVEVEDYTVRLFNIPDCPIESIFISDISKTSKLVDVYFYNYWFGSELIDSLYYNELETDIPYDPNNLRDIDELKLPVGTFTLDRVTEEVITYKDRLNTIKVFKESDWYPDLFLVDKLPDTLKYINEIINLVDWNEDVDSSIFSQALINLDYHHLNREWFPLGPNGYNLIDKNNRILYFYDDLIINNIKYPSYYPYILNIINQEYLRIPTNKLIYKPFGLNEGNAILLYKNGALQHSALILKKVGNFIKLQTKHVSVTSEVSTSIIYGLLSDDSPSLTVIIGPEDETPLDKFDVSDIKDYLVDKHINFLYYDNLTYFYETLCEQLNQDSLFIVRFITSKYTREIYKVRSKLLGVTAQTVRTQLNNILTKCGRILPLVDSSEFEFTQTNDSISVTFTIKIKSIVNRVFKMNYILNV